MTYNPPFKLGPLTQISPHNKAIRIHPEISQAVAALIVALITRLYLMQIRRTIKMNTHKNPSTASQPESPRLSTFDHCLTVQLHSPHSRQTCTRALLTNMYTHTHPCTHSVRTDDKHAWTHAPSLFVCGISVLHVHGRIPYVHVCGQIRQPCN